MALLSRRCAPQLRRMTGAPDIPGRDAVSTALASYAKGVEAMLKLPADHPHNWFRNAFVHLMDCPHGNWWFYVWHRGYLGYFEQTIRSLSGDADFALP
jgi:tyrosinase